MRDRLTTREWKVQVINMEMDHIELMSAVKHLLQHQDVVSHLVRATLIQPQRAPAHRHETGLRYRVTACEQGHVMTLANQFLSKIRNNAFGTSIVFRRHTLVERRYLCDSHIVPLLPAATRRSLRATEAQFAFSSERRHSHDSNSPKDLLLS